MAGATRKMNNLEDQILSQLGEKFNAFKTV